MNHSKNRDIYRIPAGAVPEDTVVDIHFGVDAEDTEDIKNVYLVTFYNDSDKNYHVMDRTGENGLDFTYGLKVSKGLYFYHVEIEYQNGGREYYYKNITLNYQDDNMRKWQITVYDKNFETPDRFKGGIMYHIFVDRFAKSENWTPEVREGLIMRESTDETPFYKSGEQGRDVYGGNLKGIIEKLDYLQELNVDIIYLSPIFEANTNHKYNTADFEKIDKMFGNDEVFDLLIKKAHERGMKIILDGVFNHVGDDSIYFNKFGRYDSVGAYQSKGSKYFDWFTFHDWDNNRDDYECWWGITNVPSIKKDEPVYRAYICGVNGIAEKWLKKGAAGYRLDVADELSDRMLKGIYRAVKETLSDGIIIGEVWEDASNKIAYGQRRQYLLGGQLDSVMNYPLKDAVINYLRTGNSRCMSEVMDMLTENYPKPCLDCLMNIIGTHDTMRILTALGGENFATDKDVMADAKLSEGERTRGVFLVKSAVLMQMTLPGIPCIYYGDEAGMEGYGDPFNRRFFPWGDIDGDINSFYKKICGIRSAHKKIFADGEYILMREENGLFCYKREKNARTIYVCVNLSGGEYDLKGSFASLLTGESVTHIQAQGFDIFADV